MGEKTIAASIEQIGRACGIQRVHTVNPYDAEQTQKVIAEEIHVKEPSLIVSRAACPLRERKPVGPTRRIDPEKCKACKACLELGCPAIDGAGEKPRINEFLCNGCSLCEQICPFDAITTAQEDAE